VKEGAGTGHSDIYGMTGTCSFFVFIALHKKRT